VVKGDVATNSETFVHARLPDCPACSKPYLTVFDADTATVGDLVALLKRDCKLDQPNIVDANVKVLYNGKAGVSADEVQHCMHHLPTAARSRLLSC
jgi:hypothetical protein